MPVVRTTRGLTVAERRLLGAAIRRCPNERRAVFRRSLVVSGILSSALCGLTLFLSASPRLIIVGFWVVVGSALAVWVTLDARRSTSKRLLALESALLADRADVVRISAARYVEFEEASDEGACYAFEIAENQVVFLSGQEFYPSARFPSAELALVDILGEAGQVVDSFIEKGAHKLEPARVISAARKSELRLPEHLEVVNISLDRLEESLAV